MITPIEASQPCLGARPDVMVVHNFYQQPGGEDAVFNDEVRLLQAHGHRVSQFTAHNDSVKGRSRVALAINTIWNGQAYRALAARVRAERPKIVHFHNTFPLISPAAYHAVRAQRAAVVQTLHNFRLLCPAATFLRDGKVCEDCLGAIFPTNGVRHGCYRGNKTATAASGLMVTIHSALRTWRTTVDAYIALTEFSREKFIQGGLPGGKIHVKSNFVGHDPGVGSGRGGYAIFVGRLSPEKGIDVLLSAWTQLGGAIPLKILGDGPMADMVKKAAADSPHIEWLGHESPQRVMELVGEAAFLVFPSIWYETFGKVAVEAYSRGTPVIASRLGAMKELVEHGHSGYLFEAGNGADLANKVRQFLAEPRQIPDMRRRARAEFNERYTAAANYLQLNEIYRHALARRWTATPETPLRPRALPILD